MDRVKGPLSSHPHPGDGLRTDRRPKPFNISSGSMAVRLSPWQRRGSISQMSHCVNILTLPHNPRINPCQSAREYVAYKLTHLLSMHVLIFIDIWIVYTKIYCLLTSGFLLPGLIDTFLCLPYILLASTFPENFQITCNIECFLETLRLSEILPTAQKDWANPLFIRLPAQAI